MPTSLFIEHHTNGLAFYLNGDLQFDTADESLYHEYLVVPTIALAVQRFPQTDLQVLICGGGDGLAARDVLWFPDVSHIDLVDCNPDVIELGKTTFSSYNHSSLESDRLSIHIQEAFSFVSALPANSYHAVICDFTYPTNLEETQIYSREWFEQVNRILHPGGIISTNGASPDQSTTGFWCLYQTLLAAELMAKPLQVAIPSFQRHGYGNWGFFLASPQSIEKVELETIVFPESLRSLTQEKLLQAFTFEATIANVRHQINIDTLGCPQLFYYLLNPTAFSESSTWEIQSSNFELINFLELQELGTRRIGVHNLLQLESTAQVWLEHIYQSPNSSHQHPNIEQLLPVQHRYHSPKMTAEWLTYLKQLLGQIDLSRLLSSLLERAQELPPQITRDLKQLAEKIRSGQTLSSLPPHTAELITMLSVTLLMANLVTPDAVFAKGYYSGGYSSGRSYSSGGSYGGESSGDLKVLGLFLTIFGGIWLANLYSNRSNNE
jgi:spermidine synthase